MDAPSGSSAVNVATGRVPFSGYSMVACARASPPDSRNSNPTAKAARKAVTPRARLALL